MSDHRMEERERMQDILDGKDAGKWRDKGIKAGLERWMDWYSQENYLFATRNVDGMVERGMWGQRGVQRA